MIAEVRTRRFGSLTYARSGNEAEDISVFDRNRRRNISHLCLGGKLATRGRFYSEDDLVDYDVLAYEVDTVFSPDRTGSTARAHLRVKVRAGAMTTMTLKLAEAFTVRGVYAPGFGRLLHLRVVRQNSLIVNLPSPVFRDNEFALTIVYSGRLEPSELDREAINLQSAQEREPVTIPLEPRYIYSNNSFWYPQSTVSDYALGTVRVTVPDGLRRRGDGHAHRAGTTVDRLGHGAGTEDVHVPERSAGPLSLVRHQPHVPGRLDEAADQGVGCRLRRSSRRGARSHGSSSSRLSLSSSIGRRAERAGGTASDETSVLLTVRANPRQIGRARNLAEQTSAILQFYASIVGEAPYPTFTLAVTENELPGGHSPAYFAVLNQVLPTSPSSGATIR